MPNIGPMELILVLAIALIILGPKKLPGAGRSLGRGLREFKESVAGGPERDELETGPAAPAHTPSQASAPAERDDRESRTPVGTAGERD